MGLASGLTPGRLRGPGYRQPFRGVYVAASLPVDARVRAQAALLIAPSDSAVSRHTAATLWGRAPPPDWHTHVTTFRPPAAALAATRPSANAGRRPWAARPREWGPDGRGADRRSRVERPLGGGRAPRCTADGAGPHLPRPRGGPGPRRARRRGGQSGQGRRRDDGCAAHRRCHARSAPATRSTGCRPRPRRCRLTAGIADADAVRAGRAAGAGGEPPVRGCRGSRHPACGPRVPRSEGERRVRRAPACRERRAVGGGHPAARAVRRMGLADGGRHLRGAQPGAGGHLARIVEVLRSRGEDVGVRSGEWRRYFARATGAPPEREPGTCRVVVAGGRGGRNHPARAGGWTPSSTSAPPVSD
ncbi:hypothetical protein ATL31_2968 [Phycicoccus duodecadis]|uniref:Uncharacterized protein n=1 Tax=Phycicoccus duodecadis TaxID=173053 RepID=A0A2N3YMN6_9MICO|nr:hypothetical protein ATL31_2968 [Phycicoccus duodecadis]